MLCDFFCKAPTIARLKPSSSAEALTESHSFEGRSPNLKGFNSLMINESINQCMSHHEPIAPTAHVSLQHSWFRSSFSSCTVECLFDPPAQPALRGKTSDLVIYSAFSAGYSATQVILLNSLTAENDVYTNNTIPNSSTLPFKAKV